MTAPFKKTNASVTTHSLYIINKQDNDNCFLGQCVSELITAPVKKYTNATFYVHGLSVIFNLFWRSLSRRASCKALDLLSFIALSSPLCL